MALPNIKDNLMIFRMGIFFSNAEHITQLGFNFSESLHNPCTFILAEYLHTKMLRLAASKNRKT